MEKWKTKPRFPTFPPHGSLALSKQKKRARLSASLLPLTTSNLTGKIVVPKRKKYLTPITRGLDESRKHSL
jgi:hypothetical protein